MLRKERRRANLDEKITLNKLKSGTATVSSGVGVFPTGGTQNQESRGGGAFPQIHVKGSNLHHFEEKKTTGFALFQNDKVRVVPYICLTCRVQSKNICCLTSVHLAFVSTID